MEPAPVSLRLSVLVPCLNERDNVDTLLARTSPVLDALDGELIAIDDGSDDDTFAQLSRLAATSPRLRVLRHERRQGIPQAWATGAAAARGAWVASLDADLQYQPEDLARLLELTATFDFVQGARRRLEHEGLARLALSRGLNAALNLAFGGDASDHKSALFVCRRQTLLTLLEHRRGFRHWQCFIGVSARALGLRCGELDVTFRPRTRGASAFGRIPLRSTLEVALDFWPAWKLTRRGR